MVCIYIYISSEARYGVLSFSCEERRRRRARHSSLMEIAKTLESLSFLFLRASAGGLRGTAQSVAIFFREPRSGLVYLSFFFIDEEAGDFLIL